MNAIRSARVTFYFDPEALNYWDASTARLVRDGSSRERDESVLQRRFTSAFFDAYFATEFGSDCRFVARHRECATDSSDSCKDASLEIPLPPLAEQRKIAAVLGLVQRAIEQQERLIALTTELKKALLHKLFTEGLRGEPQKQTEIGPVPESWEVTRLDNFCVLQKMGFDIIKKSKRLAIPVVSSGGIRPYQRC